MNNSLKSKSGKQQPPALEWAMAALGLMLVVGTLGFILQHAVTEKGSPPRFQVSVVSIHEAGDQGYLTEIEVRNLGGETAAEVVVEGVLHSESGKIEMSRSTMDYVPSHSVRECGLLFLHDPSKGRFVLRVAAYNKP